MRVGDKITGGELEEPIDQNTRKMISVDTQTPRIIGVVLETGREPKTKNFEVVTQETRDDCYKISSCI